HCGAVRYTVTGDFSTGLKCNCSYCQRKGTLLNFIPEANLDLLSGEDMLTVYRFHTGKIEHTFCKVCGVQCFGKGPAPDGSKMVAVNLNCLEDIDLDSVKIDRYDGRNS